jgi:peptidoglycan/LPS O-acetylase OafA/YrhL
MNDSISSALPAATRARRLDFLDSLRGLAALYVLIFHLRYLPNIPLPAIPAWMLRVANFGGTAVFLFFVISGFSLSMTMKKHLSTPYPTLSYGMSRFFRIAPLFYLLIPLTIAGELLFFHHHTRLRTVVVNVAFLFNLTPHGQEGIVWASWTIGVEMLFYALFPFFYRLSLKTVLGSTVLIYLVFVWAYHPIAPNTHAYWSVLGYLPLFAIGMLAFHVYKQVQGRSTRHLGSTFLLAGMAVLIACGCFAHAEKNVLLRIPIGLGYASVLVSCSLLRLRAVVNRVTIFFGWISYSFYLLHAPIIFALGSVFFRLFHRQPGAIAYMGAVLVSIAIITPLAYLAFTLVERPFDRFRRRLDDRITALSRNESGTSLPKCLTILAKPGMHVKRDAFSLTMEGLSIHHNPSPPRCLPWWRQLRTPVFGRNRE